MLLVSGSRTFPGWCLNVFLFQSSGTAPIPVASNSELAIYFIPTGHKYE